jgi:hypothetical protein
MSRALDLVVEINPLREVEPGRTCPRFVVCLVRVPTTPGVEPNPAPDGGLPDTPVRACDARGAAGTVCAGCRMRVSDSGPASFQSDSSRARR